MRVDPSLRSGPYSIRAYKLIDDSKGTCNWITPGSVWKIIKIAKYQAPSWNHPVYCVVPIGVTEGYCRWTMAYPLSGCSSPCPLLNAAEFSNYQKSNRY
jgi:hypothetical protein